MACLQASVVQVEEPGNGGSRAAGRPDVEGRGTSPRPTAQGASWSCVIRMR